MSDNMRDEYDFTKLNPRKNPYSEMLKRQREEIPNAETIAAIKEVEQMKRNGSGKQYNSFEELLADLNAED